MPVLPGWNSADSASWWGSLFTVLGFVCLGLLVVFEVLAFAYGNRRDSLLGMAAKTAAEEQRSKDEAKDKKMAADLAIATELAEKARMADETSKMRVSELEARLSPRLLSADQAQIIFTFLQNRTPGTVSIKASMNADDAHHYAEQIAAVLRRAGWTVRIDSAMFGGENVRGAWVTVKNKGSSRVTVGPFSHLDSADQGKRPRS